MAVHVVCPGCQHALQVAESVLGKKIRCKRCETIFIVGQAVPSSSDSHDDIPVVLRSYHQPAKPRKSMVTGLIVGAVLAIVLAVGGAWWYFHSQLSVESQPRLASAPGQAEPVLIQRESALEAFFCPPEEPRVAALEFTEPPLGDEPGGDESKPGSRNQTGQLTPDVLQRIRDSTVFLRVKMPHIGEERLMGGEGSGFFAGDPGVIVTNAHVLHMKGPSAVEPASIEVVLNKGESNESSAPAKILAVDPDADLALIAISAENAPQPLIVKSARHVQETQPVYVAGFPLGEVPGKSVTINKYDVSSLKKERGVLEKVQVHGDMLPGNSGGPVLDADGEVIGVCVSILLNTRINFAIPGDKVRRLVDGALAKIELTSPFQSGDHLHVPISIGTRDPLSRIRKVTLECWTGPKGRARPGARTAPKPKAGDSPITTLAIDALDHAGRGDLTLPALPPGETYWLRPSFVNGAGATVWLSAQSYSPPEPVEPKPIRLVLKPSGDWPTSFERQSLLEFTDQQLRNHRLVSKLDMRVVDTPLAAQGDNPSWTRHYQGFKEGVSFDGQVWMTSRLRRIPPNLAQLASRLVADPQGTLKEERVDNNFQEGNSLARPDLITLQMELQEFFQSLDVTYPADEMEPGAAWSVKRDLPTDGIWKLLKVSSFIAPWYPSQKIEMSFTYAGTRKVKGAECAVVHITSRFAGFSGGNVGSLGPVTGIALVDAATGQIVEQDISVRVRGDSEAGRGQSIIAARLRHE
jgi:S1-C subfamily serine protease